MNKTVAIGTIVALALAGAGCARSSAAPIPSAAPTTLYAWGKALGGKGGANGASPQRSTPTAVPGVEGTIVQVSTSNSDLYALTSAGQVYAFGDGGSGQLGDGSTPAATSTPVRVDFPPGVRIASLPDPMPFDEGMAIDSDGHVWGWGDDQGQELCQPHAADLDRPVKVPLTNVTAAVGALRHATYDADGRIVSCGDGGQGQLGNGTTGNSATPTAVRGLPGGTVTALTASWGDAGALMSNGAHYDWGFNHQGQLGDGTTTARDTAVHVALPAAVRQVSQGGSTGKNGQTVTVLTDGEIWEWGAGHFGQLGNGTMANSHTPQRLRAPTGVTFVKVNSGGATDYALDSTGHLWSWGRNNHGQLGTGSDVQKSLTPVATHVALTEVSSTASVAAGFERH
jgi:alpha-tubulin suppressor-like RCC1 family protein